MRLTLTPDIMPYTLWSKGRLLGHTDLDFIANTEQTKMGWFHPTEVGEQVLEIVTESSRVIMTYRDNPDRETLLADLQSAGDRVEALELELHDPNDIKLDVKDIGINDTQRLLALAAECEEEEIELDQATLDEIEASVQHDLEMLRFDDFEPDEDDRPWDESDWPRYQILVFF